jgi:hypothetical protein
MLVTIVNCPSPRGLILTHKSEEERGGDKIRDKAAGIDDKSGESG